MSNYVEFVLRLKDMLSGGMQAAARSTQRALGQNEAAARRLDSAYRRAGEGGARSIGMLERAIRRLEYRRKVSLDLSEINRANQGIEKLQRRISNLNGSSRSSSGGSGSMGSILSLGRGMAAGLGLMAITAGIGSSMNMGMKADAQRVNFETMAGAKEGGQLFKGLTKYANDSIFGTEVYQNAQTMMAFGMKSKDVMPDAKMLGDVSMGDKNRLNSLTLAYSQIQSTGQLMGQDLLQLVNAGFNPLQIISEKTGVSMADLKKKMEGGQISALMVKKAFQDATGPGGRFFDMTNRIAETPFGKWEALKGQITGVATEFGSSLMPVATTLMDAVMPIIGTLPSLVNKITPEIITMSKHLAPIIGDIGTLLLDVIPPAVKLIANVASLLAKVLSPVIKLVGFIAKSVGDKIGVIADMISMQSPKVESNTDKMMKGVATTIEANGGNIKGAMANVVAGGEIEKLFEAAGKKHGAIYADALQGLVEGIQVKMNNQEALSSFAKSGGSYISTSGAKDPYMDFLTKPPSVQEWLDQLPALMRETGLKQGRAGFEKIIKEAKNTLNGPMSALFSDPQNASKANGQVDKIAAAQRTFLEGLANGTNKGASGYEFGAGKEKGAKKSGSTKGLSSNGVTHSGPQTITININKEMFGSLQIHTVNMKEGVTELEDMIQEGVYRVFNNLKSAN